MTLARRSPAAVSAAAPDPVEALLRELVEQVRGLRADLAERRPATSLSRVDRERLARLLPAIGGTLGSEPFNSSEICEHDAAALRLGRAGLTAKQLGRLLRRAVGTPVGGYLVERLGEEAGAVLWRVVQVPEFLEVENLFVPRGAL